MPIRQIRAGSSDRYRVLKMHDMPVTSTSENDPSWPTPGHQGRPGTRDGGASRNCGRTYVWFDFCPVRTTRLWRGRSGSLKPRLGPDPQQSEGMRIHFDRVAEDHPVGDRCFVEPYAAKQTFVLARRAVNQPSDDRVGDCFQEVRVETKRGTPAPGSCSQRPRHDLASENVAMSCRTSGGRCQSIRARVRDGWWSWRSGSVRTSR